MQDAFTYVIFGVVVVGAIAAVTGLLMSGKAYDEIGKGLFFKDTAKPTESVNVAERDDEIRQMLTARNARREAAGRETVDIEAELARLTTRTEIDPALEAEIRELVIARNARRARKGQPPLDVDEEVARQIRDLA